MTNIKKNTVKIIKSEEAKNCAVWKLPNLSINITKKNQGESYTTATFNSNDSSKDCKAKEKKLIDEKINQGYNEGFKIGKEKGLAEFEEQTKKLVELQENFIKIFEQINEHVTQNVQDLSIAMAKALIHAEISTSPEIISNCIVEGLNLLPTKSKDITILVNEMDYNLLQQKIKQSVISRFKNLSIVPDKKIHSGGFIIKTPKTIIDSTIEKRLNQILTNLNENR